MRKLKVTILLALIFQITTCCGYFIGKTLIVKIPDLSKDWKEEVEVKIPEGKNVYKLEARVTGKTTEKFMLNGKKYEAGDIEVDLHNGDYYGTDYYIDYKTLEKNNIVNGNLEIKMTFYYN